MNRKRNIAHIMIVGGIIQAANNGEVHTPDNKTAANNLYITYKTLNELESNLKAKKLMTEEDYKIIGLVKKAKNMLLTLVSRNLTSWDKTRHFNSTIPEFQSNYSINRDIYEDISGETYIFCRVSNRLNGVELAQIL